MNPGLLMGSLCASMIAILSFHFRLLTNHDETCEPSIYPLGADIV